MPYKIEALTRRSRRERRCAAARLHSRCGATDLAERAPAPGPSPDQVRELPNPDPDPVREIPDIVRKLPCLAPGVTDRETGEGAHDPRAPNRWIPLGDILTIAGTCRQLAGNIPAGG